MDLSETISIATKRKMTIEDEEAEDKRAKTVAKEVIVEEKDVIMIDSDTDDVQVVGVSEFFMCPEQKKAYAQIAASQQLKKDMEKRKAMNQVFNKGREINPFFAKRVQNASKSTASSSSSRGNALSFQLLAFPTVAHINYNDPEPCDLPSDIVYRDMTTVIDISAAIGGETLHEIVGSRTETQDLVLDQIDIEDTESSSFVVKVAAEHWKKTPTDVTEVMESVKRMARHRDNIELWVDKYRPLACAHLCGKALDKSLLYQWLTEWKNFCTGNAADLTYSEHLYSRDEDSRQLFLSKMMAVQGPVCT